MNTISLIIPARNSKELTINCVESVLFTCNHLQNYAFEYILIDDNSDPIHRIPNIFLDFRKFTKSVVKIFRSKTRQHYTGVFSLGLSQAKGDLIFFISNDMMLTPDFLNTLLIVSSKEERIGIVRGTSQYIDSHSEHKCDPQFQIRNYQDILLFSYYVSQYYGDYYVEDNILSGDAVLIKREVLNAIGVMDTRFFGYFGDVDYGLRTQRAGFKLVCAKGAWLNHLGAGHIKKDHVENKEDFNKLLQTRMLLVQAAYNEFRKKWDLTLPETYPNDSTIILSILNTLKRKKVDFNEFQQSKENLLLEFEIL
jgi:GT2 family glycosyltransferase